MNVQSLQASNRNAETVRRHLTIYLSTIVRGLIYSFFVFLFTVATGDAGQLRVVSYNVRHGKGIDGRLDLERQVQVLRALTPDMVALQEVDNGVSRSESINQAKYIADKLGMHFVFGKAIALGDGQYGQALLSKFPIQKSIVHELPSVGEKRVVLEAQILVPELGKLHFCTAHYSYQSEEVRFPQVEAFEESVKTYDSPIILTGDFNAEPKTKTMQWYEAHWSVVSKTGENLTYPADEPKIEIDYCVWRGLPEKVTVASKVIPEAMASDHRPVVTVFRW